MIRLFKRPWFQLAALLVLVGNVLVGFCAYHNTWSLTAYRVYGAMDRECHPAWRDYHFGRVRAGDPVDEVIARTNPGKVVHKGRWTHLSYGPGGFTGMGAAAYDGRIVFACAMSCTWTRLFIDDLTEEQSLELLGTSKDDPRRFGIAPVIR